MGREAKKSKVRNGYAAGTMLDSLKFPMKRLNCLQLLYFRTVSGPNGDELRLGDGRF
jgi:hypothetical protein